MQPEVTSNEYSLLGSLDQVDYLCACGERDQTVVYTKFFVTNSFISVPKVRAPAGAISLNP